MAEKSTNMMNDLLDRLLEEGEISGKATLQKIADLVKQEPELAAVRVGTDQRLPLHLVCLALSLVSQHPDVACDAVGSILDAKPEATWTEDSGGLWPVHVLMNGPWQNEGDLSLRILQRFLQSFPESALARPHAGSAWQGLAPLEVAVAKNYPSAVRECLLDAIASVSHNNNNNNKESFYLTQDYSGLFTLELARFVERVLCQPHLKISSFRCHVRNFDGSAFLALLDALRRAPALTEIGCLTVPAKWIYENPTLSLACIKRLLAEHRTLETIRWVVPYGTTGTRSESLEDDPSDDSFLLQAIQEGLQDATGKQEQQQQSLLEKMEFENFVLINGPGLRDFLGSGCLPQRVSFTETVVGGDWPSTDQTHISATNKIQTLHFFRCPVAAQTLIPLVNSISMLRSLQELTLHLCNYRPGNEGEFLSTINITSPLILVLNSTQLRRLAITGALWLDIPRLCDQALAGNQTLQRFKLSGNLLDTPGKLKPLAQVLARYNTTIKETGIRWIHNINLGDDSHDDEVAEQIGKIQYWTLLNRCGRGNLRCDHSFSKGDLIQLLMGSSEKVRVECKALDLFNAHFGLLREKPSLWCA